MLLNVICFLAGSFLCGLVAFFVAGAISAERERKSYIKGYKKGYEDGQRWYKYVEE